MARTAWKSKGQHRTVSWVIGQQILLVEQCRGVKNSTKQLGTVSCGEEQQHRWPGQFGDEKDCIGLYHTE